MFFFDSSRDRDVRDGQDGKDKGLHPADEEAEESPERPRQPRNPGRNQHDDQGQQELADENVEVTPEGQRDGCGLLINDGERKVRRNQEQVLEVSTEMSRADAEV